MTTAAGGSASNLQLTGLLLFSPPLSGPPRPSKRSPAVSKSPRASKPDEAAPKKVVASKKSAVDDEESPPKKAVASKKSAAAAAAAADEDSPPKKPVKKVRECCWWRRAHLLAELRRCSRRPRSPRPSLHRSHHPKRRTVRVTWPWCLASSARRRLRATRASGEAQKGAGRVVGSHCGFV